jgi:cytochrome P450
MYVTVVAGAGNETTGRLIGWLASTLARHPGRSPSWPPVSPGRVQRYPIRLVNWFMSK